MISLPLVASRGRHGSVLLWRREGKTFARSLSSTAARRDDTPNYTTLIPFLHSRKKLPPVCTDVEELQDLTEHVLDTPAGNLFQFERGNRSMDRQDRDEAWEVADGTVQMVEFLVRGHSAQIPGTLWNGWAPRTQVPPTEAEDPLTNLETITALLDRMWEEGLFYMEVRRDHLSQLVFEEELKAQEDPIEEDWRAFAGEEAKDTEPAKSKDGMDQMWENMQNQRRAARERGEIDAEDDFEDEYSAPQDAVEFGEKKSEAGEGDKGVMNDFALPGPTTEMYDILLDTMAVTALTAGDPQSFANRRASDILTANAAMELLGTIDYRHGLDSGDDLNNNPHTMPTQISYNGVMRTCVNLHWDGKNEVLRDLALIGATTASDNLTLSSLPRNSSTYAYQMQLLAKYMPACEARGRMIHGLWMMARRDGVFDGQVLDAYMQASTPSNTPIFEEFIEKHIRDKDWRKDGPQRWRRRVKTRRLTRRQTTY